MFSITEQNCIKKKINDIINIKKVEEKEKEMIYSGGDYNYYLSEWNYIYGYYQSIEEKDDLYPPFLSRQLPSFLEMIYKMALGNREDPNNWCTGQITLKPNKILETKYDNFNYETDKDSFNEFLDEFHKYLNVAKCKFTSLALNCVGSAAAHRSMILIYRVKSDQFYMYWFEPNGYVPNYSETVGEFIEYLQSSYTKRFYSDIKLEKDTVPKICPLNVSSSHKSYEKKAFTGIQRKSQREGRVGYCVMYSYLWLYLVLSCTKSGVDVIALLEGLESFLDENYTSEYLSKLVVLFAGKAVNFYIQDTQKTLSKDKLEIFNRMMENAFSEVIIGGRAPLFKSKTKLKSKQEGESCKRDSECVSNYCDPISNVCGKPLDSESDSE